MTDIDFAPALTSLMVELDNMDCAFSRCRFYYFPDQRALYVELPWNDRMLFTEEHGWKRAERAKFNDPRGDSLQEKLTATPDVNRDVEDAEVVSHAVAVTADGFRPGAMWPGQLEFVGSTPSTELDPHHSMGVEIAEHITSTRPLGCTCDREVGDSACAVHPTCSECGAVVECDLVPVVPARCRACGEADHDRPSTPPEGVLRTALARARKNRLPATLTKAEWGAILHRFAYRCAVCHGPWSVVGHAMPIALGGGTTAENCFPQCIKCNVAQGTKEIALHRLR